MWVSLLDRSGFTIISPVDSMVTNFVLLDGYFSYTTVDEPFWALNSDTDEEWILIEKNEGSLIIAYDQNG